MKDQAIKDFSPDKILINCEVLKNVTTDYEKWYEPENERIKYKELSLTLGADALLNLFALVPSFGVMSKGAITFSVIILIVLFIYFVVCLVKWNESYRKVNGKEQPYLDKMLVNHAKSNMKYTAIGRIAYKNKGEILYLTDNEYFLPHCNMDENLPIKAQEKNILQSLHDNFNIKENDIIKVVPIDNKVHYSIKPIHGSIQMNAFAFYDVIIKEQMKSKLTQSNSKHKWVSVSKMKNNNYAMATNKDVIELLETFTNPNDSFVNILGNIKIIWNITSKCPYNCAICATFDENRSEIDAGGKLKVLNSICSAKHMIKNVDFAGGDPLHFDECTTIIQSAIEQLGKDKVSITTTGKGISESSNNEFLGVVKHCEITIDAAHNNLKDSNKEEMDSEFVSRDENEYSKSNIDNINLISNHADSLTINIPIINDDLTEQEIDNLVTKVLWVKNHTAGLEVDTSLIRLMPVGKLAKNIDKEKYKQYNPIEIAKRIKSKLEENNIKCKYHCSLRILPSFNNDISTTHCSMLENKIGIDCEGNVFACAWGGYIRNNNPPTKNPFYLGNLTKVPLIKILENTSKTHQYINILNEIDNKNYRNFCSVVSYYIDKELFNNKDPLA